MRAQVAVAGFFIMWMMRSVMTEMIRMLWMRWSNIVPSGFDSFFDAEAETRATCREKSKYLPPIIGLLVTLLAFVAMLVAVVKMRKRTVVVVEVEEYTLPPVIEEEEEEEEEEETIPCYCEVPMENCIVCDEAFAKDLGRQCDILEVEKDDAEEDCEVLENEVVPFERKKSKELEGIEEVLEAIDQKLGDIDQRFEGINLELEGLDQELEGEFEKKKEMSANEDTDSSQKKEK